MRVRAGLEFSILHGIAEFKCPYSKRDYSPYEACADPDFFCEVIDGQFRLKRQHQYYHQVQLQLYVSSDKYSRVYTPVDVAMERIYQCKKWERKHIPELEEYFDTHMVPEIVDLFINPVTICSHLPVCNNIMIITQ